MLGTWEHAGKSTYPSKDCRSCPLTLRYSLDGVFLPSSPMFGNFILAFHSGNLLELSQLH